jgi:ribosomal peptide maturation radical SAM protein 1
VDNILDMRYFETFLPGLAARESRLNLFYEVKANLTRDQVRLLAEAGVRRIQPGIESLSDHVLKLMRKGTTALRNVQLLKWCREHGVEVDWNLLYGFPGETAADYAASLVLMRAIRFLQPPGACGPVRLDRFSPYFNQPESFGMTGVRPMAAYRALYPFAEESLRRIAYYFDYGYRPDVNPRGAAADVIRDAHDWRARPEPGSLWAQALEGGGLALHDSRSDAPQPQVALSPVEAAAYRYCDEVRSGPSVVRFLRDRFPAVPIEDDRVLGFLGSLAANRLMVSDGVHYLGLALGAGPEEEPAEPVRRAA